MLGYDVEIFEANGEKNNFNVVPQHLYTTCAQCAHGVHSVHIVCTDLFADAAITVSVGLLRQHSAAPLGTCVIPHKKKAYTS